MKQEEIEEKKDPALRLPRQADRYSELVSHFVSVKNSDQIARAMQAHFQRLARYHQSMIKSAVPEAEGEE